MIPMPFEYPPRLGWCTKHNSTTVCKDCEIESLREENKRYREALEKISILQLDFQMRNTAIEALEPL